MPILTRKVSPQTRVNLTGKARDNFISLTLALLGVIQGLALNHLADKIGILEHPGLTACYASEVLGFVVSFSIIVRVFQTYFTGAILKSQSYVDTFDLMSMFAVGLLQYWVINGVGSTDNSSIDLHVRIAVLGVAAFILHLRTRYRVKIGDIELDPPQKRQALLSERWNLGISGAITIICGLDSILNGRDSLKIDALVSALVTILLLVNIWGSLEDMNLDGRVVER